MFHEIRNFFISFHDKELFEKFYGHNIDRYNTPRKEMEPMPRLIVNREIYVPLSPLVQVREWQQTTKMRVFENRPGNNQTED